MKKIIILLLVLSSVVAILFGNDLKNGLRVLNKSKEKPLADPVCFTRDVLPLFVSYCGSSGCHDSKTRKEGIDLTNYSGIKAKLKPGNPDDSEIYIKMVEANSEDRMPPLDHPQPTQSQISLIRQWIQEGANNTSCSNAPCDTSNVSYNGNIKPILQTNCIGCHSGSNPSGGIDFSNDAIVQSMKMKILGSVLRLTGYVAMPPPFTLNDCYKAQIRIWVVGNLTGPCDTSKITYSGSIKPILQNLCFSCHTGYSSPLGLDFSNDNISDNSKMRIYGAIAGLSGYKAMPPGFKADTCSIKKIRIWALPNVTGPCDTTHVTYDSTIKSILQKQCISCHSGTNPPKGLDFTSDTLVKINKTRIYGAVAGLSGYTTMPPGIKADSCTVKQIKIWAYPKITEPCDTSNVTFSGTIKPLMQTQCLSCHSGANPPLGLDYTKDSIIIRATLRIYGATSKITGYATMPPGITLDTCSTAKYRIWALQKDNKPCDTNNITYSGTIRPIIVNNCVTCHSGPNPPKGLDLSIDTVVINSRKLVYAASNHVSGYKPMPPGLFIDSCSLTKLRIWSSAQDTTPCDTTGFSFLKTIKLILKANCTSCHRDGIDAPNGLDFTIDSISLANRKLMYCGVSGGSGCAKMPPKTVLDSCDIFKFKIWSESTINDVGNEFTDILNLKVYPNPAGRIINISYELNTVESVEFRLFGINGSEIPIKASNGSRQPGVNNENIPIEGTLPSGTFILRITIGDKDYIRQFNIIN
ncbi:MAG: hypothetical protein HW421_772 [Ignavibacteria bacterium]|nr:hypothetical protein [Ignavibacteria bacterium]